MLGVSFYKPPSTAWWYRKFYKMKISTLQDESKYRLVRAMPIDELKPFVVENIRKENKYAAGYIMLNYVLLFGVILFIAFSPRESAPFKILLMYFGIGVALCFSILIVLHEIIHGIAFKLVGAPKVSFGGSIRKFVFYAAANKFVANRNSFSKVALAPFVVITALSIVTFLFGNVYLKWLAVGVLLGHTSLCGGDFAMLSFFEEHKEKEMFTYDDMENKIMYFYEKIAPKSLEEDDVST